MDEKGYMVREDYSSFEEVDAEEHAKTQVQKIQPLSTAIRKSENVTGKRAMTTGPATQTEGKK